jgi:hypothetical protein
MTRSAARRIIDEQPHICSVYFRAHPTPTIRQPGEGSDMRTRDKHQEPLPNTTHDRDCTNVQGLLSKRSTPCQLHRRCTDTVAWRGGRRKQQQSKRNRNSPGVPHQKEYPCQLYRAKAKVTWHRGCLCCFVVTYVRYQNTERKASDRSDRTPQVQPLFLNE